MAWQIEFDPAAVKQLEKLDKPVRKRIIDFLENRAAANPRDFGEATTGKLSGYWKYRIGNYRVVVEIIDQRMTIFVIKAKHRSIVYK